MSDIPFFDSSEGGDDFFSQLSQSTTVNPSPFQERPQSNPVLSQSAPFPSATPTPSNFPPTRNDPFVTPTPTTPFSTTPNPSPFPTPVQNTQHAHVMHTHRKSMSLSDTPSDIPFSDSSDDSADFFSTLSISGTQSAPVSAQPPRHADPNPRPLSVTDLKPQPVPTFAAPFPKATTTPFPTPSHTPTPTPVSHTPVPFPGTFTPYNPVQQTQKTFTAPFPQAPMSPGVQRVSNTEFHRTNSLPTFSSFQATSPFGSPTKDNSNARSMSASTNMMQPRDYERKPQPIVAFGFGGKLITMIPRKRRALFGNQQDNTLDRVPNTFHVHSLQKLLGNTPHMQSLAAFPGPLTNAAQVQKFVTDKINSSFSESFDAEASRLLWQLIKILCDHYGNISGVDNPAQKSIKEILTENLPASTQAPLLVSASPQDEHAAVVELQRLIVSGNVDEAYRYAVSAQLWSHALVLSSYMSPDTFKATVAQFTDTTIREGSPIRTLYLLLAGRKQDLFGGSQTYSNALGGLLERWRENLVTLINSRTGDKQVISTLGDKLWAFQKKVEAAHFCYITSDYEFDYVDNPNTRIVLLGGDHKICPRTYATPESIQRTEILEFARTLGNPQYSIPQIQPYKLIYALMLAEAGHLETAKKYVQAISNVISRNRNYPYNQFFLHHLEQLEQRLNGFSTKEFSSSNSGSWIPLPKLSSMFKIGKWRSDSNPQQPAQAAEPEQLTRHDSNSNNIVPPLNLSTPAPSTMVPSQPPPAETEKTHESPRANVESSKKSESPGWGITSKVTGLLSVFGKLGNQADLGEEIAYEYNKELGVWLKKGEKPSAAVAQMTAPPPVFATATPPPMSTGGPPSMDGPSGPPSFTSPSASGGGGGRRMRYVDTFNQGTAPTAPAPRRDSGARQSLNFAGTIFTPAMMPNPTEMPVQEEQQQQQQQVNTPFQTPFPQQPPQNM